MTTHQERFSEAITLLCHGAAPPPEIVTQWLAGDSDELQHWIGAAGTRLPWAQCIAIAEAAQVLAEQPEEDAGHEHSSTFKDYRNAISVIAQMLENREWAEIHIIEPEELALLEAGISKLFGDFEQLRTANDNLNRRLQEWEDGAVTAPDLTEERPRPSWLEGGEAAVEMAVADGLLLLPCPFCGSANIDARGWASEESAGPACDDCGGSAGDSRSTPEVNALTWNRRTALSGGQEPVTRRERDLMLALGDADVSVSGGFDGVPWKIHLPAAAPAAGEAAETVAWHIEHPDGLVSLRKGQFVDEDMIEQATADGLVVRPLIFGGAATPALAAVADAEILLFALNSGFGVVKNDPSSYLTDAANKRMAWSVSRVAPPFCDRTGARVWSGPTPSAAVEAAAVALGMKLPAKRFALAVDLEQFRPFVQQERDYLVGRIERCDAIGTADRLIALQNKLKHCDQLLAVIDRQQQKEGGNA